MPLYCPGGFQLIFTISKMLMISLYIVQDGYHLIFVPKLTSTSLLFDNDLLQVFDNTPAAKEGTLESGDELVGINDTNVKVSHYFEAFLTKNII